MRGLLPAPLPEGEVDLHRAYAWPERTCVRVNFVSSLDGAATLDGRTGSLGTPADKVVFSHLRATADAIVVGARTASVERYGPARVPIVVVSGRLSMAPDERLFTPTPGTVAPIVLTCAAAPAARRAALGRHVKVVDCGDERVEPRLLVDELERRGLRRLLCEGGPRLFADLLAGGVVDELCLTVTPMLAPGDAPRITCGGALPVPQQANLVSALEEDSTLLLRYSLR